MWGALIVGSFVFTFIGAVIQIWNAIKHAPKAKHSPDPSPPQPSKKPPYVCAGRRAQACVRSPLCSWKDGRCWQTTQPTIGRNSNPFDEPERVTTANILTLFGTIIIWVFFALFLIFVLKYLSAVRARGTSPPIPSRNTRKRYMSAATRREKDRDRDFIRSLG